MGSNCHPIKRQGSWKGKFNLDARKGWGLGTAHTDSIRKQYSQFWRSFWNWSSVVWPASAWLFCCSVPKSRPTLCDPMNCAALGLPVFHWLLELSKFMSLGSVMPSYHLILFCPLLLLPSVFPSIKVLANELALCIWWPKSWNFRFSISPPNGYLRLTSFRIDGCDLLPVQGTFQSLLQHHSLEASILWHSVFFMVNSHIRTWLLERP